MKSYRQVLLSASAVALTTAIMGSAAYAEDAPAPAPAPKAAVAEDAPAIIVTGSRLSRPGLESPIPVTSIKAADLLSGGSLSIGDSLNKLPGLRSTFSQSNSERFIGTSGLNELDLRGLGTNRTLVLVDGHRHVSSAIGAYIVDVNDIPPDLLERVDVVTGGDSAIYGSDAVAGVVNFVMKKNYSGIKVEGQGGASGRGDRGSYYGSIVAGQNFSEGRGNIAVAAEFSHVDALYNIQRDDETGAYSGRSQFNLSTNSAIVGNTAIQNLYYNGVRNNNISDGGLVSPSCTAAVVNNPAYCTSAGFAQRYMFDSAGNLVLNNPTLDFRSITGGISNNSIGGNGSTLRNTGQLDPLNERISVDVVGHYDFADWFKISTDTKYVRIKVNQEGQPSFFQGGLLGTFSCANPFLSAQALATLQSFGRCARPTNTFAVSRFNVDFGGRGELTTREVFRTVETVYGNFKNGWSYEVAANFGSYVFNTRSLNNLQYLNIDGTAGPYLKAMDAVRNAQGQIVCRVNAVTVTDAACVPINVFGYGAPSQAALNYVNTTAYSNGRNHELDVTGFIKGDFGKFRLPGGPIGFVVGGEYRSEGARSQFDPLTASGATFLNAIQPFNPPTLISKEGFVEVNLPFFKDKPFIKELTLHGAGRVSNYNNSTGTVYTYNGDLEYAPIKDIRFRTGYARAVRAPTQSDLYATASQNFASISDPCDVANINNGSTTRKANCAAAGVPTGFVNDLARSQTLAITSQGNPTLQAETSRSFTAGVVIQPHQISGLSFTADYYNITIKNAIATLGAQTIINNCYDLPTLNNQYCPLVSRNSTTNLFNSPATISGPVNFAQLKTSGIDFELNYTHKFTGGTTLNLHGLATYVIVKNFYLDPLSPTNYTHQLGVLGDPQFAATASADVKHGAVTLHYDVRYLGVMTIGTYETQHSVNGNPPQNPYAYPFPNYPGTFYHNVSTTFEIAKRFSLKLGVDNLLDTLPPYGLQGTGAGDGIYDNVGRTYYARVSIKY